MNRRTLSLVCPLALVSLTAAGCSSDPVAAETAAGGPADSITVAAADKECTVSSTELPAGINTFAISNEGTQVTEVYVYDGDRIVTEKENIGPGTSYDLTVDLTEGEYEVACKPGMVGDGIRQAVSVSGTSEEADPLAEQAVQDYRTFVAAQAEQLVPLVEQFAAAVEAGDVAAAKGLYATSREPWERIEPVAESFGDLDPRIDVREADLEDGQKFSGWHRIEKALWTGEDLAPMAPVAQQLVLDVTELRDRVPNAAITATSIGNGAKELLDEVATGKITGEEEAFSHTDLVDFQANLDGAKEGFEVLRPLVDQNDPELSEELDTQFAAVQASLEPYAEGEGFVSYDTVDEAGRRELARVVDSLSEPLSQLAAATVAQ